MLLRTRQITIPNLVNCNGQLVDCNSDCDKPDVHIRKTERKIGGFERLVTIDGPIGTSPLSRSWITLRTSLLSGRIHATRTISSPLSSTVNVFELVLCDISHNARRACQPVTISRIPAVLDLFIPSSLVASAVTKPAGSVESIITP